MVVLPSRSSSLCADDPSVTASPLVLSHYYSKLLSPFFEELMPVNQLNPNQLLKEKYLVLCSFEIPFHIALLGKRWWDTAYEVYYVVPLLAQGRA